MYTSLKVKSLKALMKERGIPIYDHYKKKDLIVALKMRDFLEEQEAEKSSPIVNNDRIVELRISKNHINLEDFEEPLSVVEADVDTYLYPILTEPEADPGDFPNNIAEVYWGYADNWEYEGSWKLFCKLYNGNYAYLDAWVCSCGFGMWPDQLKLYVAKSYEDIIKYAMSQSDYESYMEDTEPMQEDSKEPSCGCMKGVIVEEIVVMRV